MFALQVVEELDEVEHILAGFFMRSVFSVANAFTFEEVEETFRHRIIPISPATAHTLHQILDLE